MFGRLEDKHIQDLHRYYCPEDQITDCSAQEAALAELYKRKNSAEVLAEVSSKVRSIEEQIGRKVAQNSVAFYPSHTFFLEESMEFGPLKKLSSCVFYISSITTAYTGYLAYTVFDQRPDGRPFHYHPMMMSNPDPEAFPLFEQLKEEVSRCWPGHAFVSFRRTLAPFPVRGIGGLTFDKFRIIMQNV